MYYISPTPNPSGAYPAPQSSAVPGLLPLPEGLLADFLAYNGFVTPTLTDGVITALTPNLAAWEAWKAALPTDPPEPEPTAQEDMDALLVEHEYRLTLLELEVI